MLSTALFVAFSLFLQISPRSALAQEDGGTSANWGPDRDQKLNDIYSNLANLSGIANDSTVQRHFYPSEPDYQSWPALATCVTNSDDGCSLWYIVVNASLFDIVHNEDELAFVLGHEISHVVQKHGTIRAKFLAVLCEKWKVLNTSPLTGDALIQACEADATTMASVNHLDRNQENEADANSINLMHLARPQYNDQAALCALRHRGDWAWASDSVYNGIVRSALASVENIHDDQHDPSDVRANRIRDYVGLQGDPDQSTSLPACH